MTAERPTISTHVLDTQSGTPAVGVAVTLYRLDPASGPARLTTALTDEDGRIRDLLGRPLRAGRYRLAFDTTRGREDSFFRYLAVEFEIRDVGRSYHVPLLLAPFGMTTYRGS